MQILKHKGIILETSRNQNQVWKMVKNLRKFVGSLLQAHAIGTHWYRRPPQILHTRYHEVTITPAATTWGLHHHSFCCQWTSDATRLAQEKVPSHSKWILQNIPELLQDVKNLLEWSQYFFRTRQKFIKL